MSGETNLDTLLRTLNPSLQTEIYVFCSIPNAKYGDWAHTHPIASVMEEEGLTLILSQASADQAGLSYSGTFRCIELQVHSSLEAVGLPEGGYTVPGGDRTPCQERLLRDVGW